ncbi:MAG: amino acid transporter [Actinomycetota bacterium]|nr:amino acid transporter [Actinomycetota bacterium]
MARSTAPSARSGNSLTRWLLKHRIEQAKGPGARESEDDQHPWWQVVCLTGVDYFSTLGYIPGIALAAAGALSPIATMLIVLLTLFGALPMYRIVARKSPTGQGSIAMLEDLLSFWKGKLFVLCLLGFVATGWVVTITLSASDATAHIVENPFWPESFGHADRTLVIVTLVLIGLLGAVFLRGFQEAIGIAVVTVGAYLVLNLIVVAVGFYEVFANPQVLADWQTSLFSNYGNPFSMLTAAIVVFPLLALGLSGFETGVGMMPLVRGDADDDPEHPAGRIRNTRKLLTVAAVTMCFYLITTSFITTMLVPVEEARSGEAKGRALAYLAHEHLGDAFGTVYDASTIAILWFAGASAMAGLLNIVPRYLPRYGMAPEWGRAVRPLVLVYTLISVVVVVVFAADPTAQAGAYATGVLAMMTSGAIAVTIAVHRQGRRLMSVVFGLITVVFAYATVANIVDRPDGITIALLFIAAIIAVSLVSRVQRSLELRQERIEIDAKAQEFIREASKGPDIHIVAHRRRSGHDPAEYAHKEREQREDNHIPEDQPILFLEVSVEDASEFTDVLEVRGVDVGGHKVLRAVSSVVPNAIAALLLDLRDTTGKTPHCYFGWTEGNPIVYLIRFILFGEGDTAPVTHEVLREAEPEASRRPLIHVGGR